MTYRDALAPPAEHIHDVQQLSVVVSVSSLACACACAFTWRSDQQVDSRRLFQFLRLDSPARQSCYSTALQLERAQNNGAQ